MGTAVYAGGNTVMKLKDLMKKLFTSKERAAIRREAKAISTRLQGDGGQNVVRRTSSAAAGHCSRAG